MKDPEAFLDFSSDVLHKAKKETKKTGNEGSKDDCQAEHMCGYCDQILIVAKKAKKDTEKTNDMKDVNPPSADGSKNDAEVKSLCGYCKNQLNFPVQKGDVRRWF